MDYLLNKELAEDIQLLSKFGKLLSHPARINIITMIARNGNKLPISLVKELGYSPKSTEKHIEELLNIGLIYIRKNERKEEIYALDLEVYSQFKELFDKFFNTSWGLIQNKNIKTTTIKILEETIIADKQPENEQTTDKDLISFIKST